MGRIVFGTDGWRAVIAEDYTFENVRICTQGVADYLTQTGRAPNGLVVGYDKRFASENFAASTAEVLAANGVKVYLCDHACPIPAATYAILGRHAAGAAVITASHNPWTDNGFKYKPEYAGSASPEVVAQLEARIREVEDGKVSVKRMALDQAIQKEMVDYFDPDPAYMDQMARLVDLQRIKDGGLRVAFDAMHGAGAGYMSRLVGGGRTQIHELRPERNPWFDGKAPEPIPRNLQPLLDAMSTGNYDIGLTTDGDADRVGMVDEKGRFVTQLQVYALLALYLLEARGERGPLVKSITTTSMAYRLGELYNVPVYETSVGFKYLGPKMQETNAIMAGEESGGFAFHGHIPERDGILASLYLMDLVLRLGKKPSELIDYLYSKVGGHYYDRIDVHFPAERRTEIVNRMETVRPDQIAGSPVKEIDRKDGVRFFLQDGSWLLIRFSGTEPIMRVYTETTSPDRIPVILQEGRELAGV
ncbi:MAG: phosphoglucomutase/phosphomannomutase family protein [Chloroflexota bacterium]|nr:MAG: phosphoglucomutase/phosphomannomutase family protein [Chloroflexota bacterium]